MICIMCMMGIINTVLLCSSGYYLYDTYYSYNIYYPYHTIYINHNHPTLPAVLRLCLLAIFVLVCEAERPLDAGGLAGMQHFYPGQTLPSLFHRSGPHQEFIVPCSGPCTPLWGSKMKRDKTPFILPLQGAKTVRVAAYTRVF